MGVAGPGRRDPVGRLPVTPLAPRPSPLRSDSPLSTLDSLGTLLPMSRKRGRQTEDDLAAELEEERREWLRRDTERREAERREGLAPATGARTIDRKSTRLNSSHANISYAVF